MIISRIIGYLFCSLLLWFVTMFQDLQWSSISNWCFDEHTREPPIIDYDLVAPVYDTYGDEVENVVLCCSPVFPSLHESRTTLILERENDTILS